MKKLAVALAAVFSAVISIPAQTPPVEWAKAMGGTGNDRANGIETDTKGHVVLVGRFQSPVIRLDSIMLTKCAEDAADAADIFIIKLDKDGNPLWAISAGGKGDDHATGCAVDKDDNVYVVGWFESRSITWGHVTLTKQGEKCDFFVAKFSPDGKCIWAVNAGGEGSAGDYGQVSLGSEHTIFVSGFFSSGMKFSEDVVLTTEKPALYVAGYTHAGKLLWAKSAAGNSAGESSCSGDPEGNVFIGGFFNAPAFALDSIVLQNSSEEQMPEAFVAKYSPEGKALWAKKVSGEGPEIASCATDPWGNVILAGISMSPEIALDSITLSNSGEMNTFVSKWDTRGNVLWAKNVTGGTAIGSREVYVDSEGGIYLTGSARAPFVFAGDTIKTVGAEDIFLLKYDADGREEWAVTGAGSTGRNAGRGVAAGKTGNLFLTGSFNEKELRFRDQRIPSAGDDDIFIVKLGVPLRR